MLIIQLVKVKPRYKIPLSIVRVLILHKQENQALLRGSGYKYAPQRKHKKDVHSIFL